MDLRAYWRRRRALEAELPAVVTLHDPATGRTLRAGRVEAAASITDHGFRLASEAEAGILAADEARRATLERAGDALARTRLLIAQVPPK
jgi:hypothetical protein